MTVLLDNGKLLVGLPYTAKLKSNQSAKEDWFTLELAEAEKLQLDLHTTIQTMRGLQKPVRRSLGERLKLIAKLATGQ